MHGRAQKADTRDAKADSAASPHAIDLELFTVLVAKESSIDQDVPPIIALEIETIVIDTDVRESHADVCAVIRCACRATPCHSYAEFVCADNDHLSISKLDKINIVRTPKPNVLAKGENDK